MDAIAQTLNRTETFNTKEELFDYVFSQLFGSDWILNTIGSYSFLQIGTKIFPIESTIRIVSSIKIEGMKDIENEGEFFLELVDIKETIPSIYVLQSDEFGSNWAKFSGNNIVELDINYENNYGDITMEIIPDAIEYLS